MNVREYLDTHHARYTWTTHADVYTGQGLAESVHESGYQVVKPVVMQADGEFVICAIPSCMKVDLELVREVLNARSVSLAGEPQMSKLFDGCELGAEPPLGEMFRLRTLMDDSLCGEQRITFQAGTHHDAVSMSLAEFLRLTEPMVAHVTYGN